MAERLMDKDWEVAHEKLQKYGLKQARGFKEVVNKRCKAGMTAADVQAAVANDIENIISKEAQPGRGSTGSRMGCRHGASVSVTTGACGLFRRGIN